MSKYKVAITRYKKDENSVRSAIELSDAVKNIKSSTKVFLKPNIVFWTKETNFPKYGVITTSRVVEDVVVALKDIGVNDITIGEGLTGLKPKDFETPKHAFKTLGYDYLKEKYGVKCLNVFDRDFKKVDAGDGISLNINEDILNTENKTRRLANRVMIFIIVFLIIISIKYSESLVPGEAPRSLHTF